MRILCRGSNNLIGCHVLRQFDKRYVTVWRGVDYSRSFCLYCWPYLILRPTLNREDRALNGCGNEKPHHPPERQARRAD